MHRLPPSVKTNLHPDDIIGGSLRTDFANHYRLTSKCDSIDQFNAAIKSISPSLRNTIADIYTVLLENGWHPMGLDQFGNIKWHYRVSHEFDTSGTDHIKRPHDAKRYIESLIGRIGCE